MVVSRPRQPLLPPLLLLECALESPVIRNPGGNTHARQHGTFRTGNRQLDGGTAPSTTLSGKPLLVSEELVFLLLACPITQQKIDSVKSPRAPTRSPGDSHGVIPATGISASSVIPPSQVRFSKARTRDLRDVPLGHGLSLATGTRASSAVLLSCVIYSTMGVRAPNAVAINHGTGACALRAPPQARVAQQYSCGDRTLPFYANVFIPSSP